MSAAQGRSNRNRGARAEVQVVNYLRQWWPDARRYLAGDGRQPGDIDAHPLLTIEVRDRKASAWPTWCRQAVAEAPPGTVPVVVRRTRGVTDVGLWECRWQYPSPLATACAALEGHHWVDQEMWCHATFADLIAAVRALDTEGAQ